MKFIGYYIRNIKPDLSKRNSWAIMLLYDDNQWKPRNKEPKGAKMHLLRFRRNMMPAELEEQAASYRLIWYRYTNWQDLLEDEEQILGEGHPFLDVLREEMKKHDLIPTHKVGKQQELF
jgi:hypothetical protein